MRLRHVRQSSRASNVCPTGGFNGATLLKQAFLTMRLPYHRSMMHAEVRKRALSLALTSAPVLGGVLLAVWLLKRRRRKNLRGKSHLDQAPGGAAPDDEVSSGMSSVFYKSACRVGQLSCAPNSGALSFLLKKPVQP